MTEESAVKVCVRVRPLISREECTTSENSEPVQLFWKADQKSIQQTDDGNSSKSFIFDRVFTSEETTNQLYQDIAKPLVVSSVQGYNGTIFAYGQTSSGKTFTMMGGDHIPGVIPLAVEDVFQTIKNCPKKEFLLRVSYMEIYNETVTDLLVDSWKRKPLEVRETINKNIYVADLTEELVTNPSQALAWIRKGEKNRHYGKTKMNERSSRSHTIFRMILESRERSDSESSENADGAIIVSHLNLVDLAGSERASQTGAEGARFKEGCNINRSLFTLGQVIKKLTDENQKGFTNYRDSKLTRILQNSLGGNAKTVIICTITPVALDETLSTLQFASTAKKMKNDPHVTEVSDDGALLKRYRDEITDLKRRLYEVSSVTQTTATEKKILSQLLHEKDHLQREQQDRIRNLTKLLVTSSNLVPVKKLPKRRVTWGGKMLRLAPPSAFDVGASDHSFAEAVSLKRKYDGSCLMELTEDDEEFDSQWEPSDYVEVSQTSVTVRSFEDSPTAFASPHWSSELTEKLSNIELQLKMERQQKEVAAAQVEALKGRVEELQLQLQTEAQLKQDALEKIQRTTKLELQHLAEAANHEVVITERDCLRQELDMLVEQNVLLENKNASLERAMEDKREMAEFELLEEQFRKENENELKQEVTSLKNAIEVSEIHCQELLNKIESLSEELRKKTDITEELQNLNGKDLVQEVSQLRRSLADAVVVSKDAKKDCALLRSQKMAFEEDNFTLSARHEKMEVEVNSLGSQLQMEKSRYKKMESDLQKELNFAFNENTKLSALLEGKIPKDLRDSMELGCTVTNLTKELTASRQSEGDLRSQLKAHVEQNDLKLEESYKQIALLRESLNESQQRIQDLAEKFAESEASRITEEELSKGLQEQLKQLTQELCCVQAERDDLLSAQTNGVQTLDKGMDQLFSQVTSLTAERDQLKVDLQENVEMTIENQGELRTALEKIRELKVHITLLQEAQTSKEESVIADLSLQLEAQQKHVKTLNKELLHAQEERDALLLEKKDSGQTSEETEELRGRLLSLTEERDRLQNTMTQDKLHIGAELEEKMETILQLKEHLEMTKKDLNQLKSDLQDKLQFNQGELTAALEKIEEQKEQIRLLELAQTFKEESAVTDLSSQLEAQQEHVKTLNKELQHAQAERDALLLEKKGSGQTSEETDELLGRLLSLTDERNRLQETMRQEKLHLGAELEEKMETIQQLKEHIENKEEEMKALTEKLHSAEMDRDSICSERESSCRISTLEREKLLCRIASLNEERDGLQETLQVLREEKQQLREEQEEKMETLQCETLNKELQHAQEERDTLLLEKKGSGHTSEETEELLGRPLSRTEERNQLQETTRQDKLHLGAELEEKMETIQQLKEHLDKNKEEMIALTEKLHVAETDRDGLRLERESSRSISTQEREMLLCKIASLNEERAALQDTLQVLSEEKQQLKVEQEEKMQTLQCEVKTLDKELEHAQAERDALLLERKHSEEQNQLQETMTMEKLHLRAELEEKMETIEQLKLHLENNKEEMMALADKLHCVETNGDVLRQEMESSRRMSTLEMENLLARITSLNEERDVLQDTLQVLREETQQLRVEQKEKMETLHCEVMDLKAKLQSAETETQRLSLKTDSLGDERNALQETLRGLRREKQQLTAELREKMDMVSDIQETLSTRQSEGDHVTQLQNEVQQLVEQLQMYRENQMHSKAEAEASQQLLSEANKTILTLTQQLSSLGRGTTTENESLSARLHNSTGQLQETFRGFQLFLDTCLRYCSAPIDEVLRVQSFLKHQFLPHLPKATMDAHTTICRLGLQTVQTLGNIIVSVKVQAQDCRARFEELVKIDLAVFEEKRLQDVLLCRLHAPNLSLKDEDFNTLWAYRLTELLQKRELYQQKMAIILEKLMASISSYPSEVSAEITERERFREQLRAIFTSQPTNSSVLDSVLSHELERRAAVEHCKKNTLQSITNEHMGMREELALLEAPAFSQLKEEKSRSSTLLQALQGVPLKTEVSLLKDNQQLTLQLQQTEEKVAALYDQNNLLKEAHAKADYRLSNHRQATQLLQTELQDSRAQNDEKDDTIQALRSKLRESEQKVPAGTVEAVETNKIRMDSRMASFKHQQEIRKMPMVLNEKQNSLGSQQNGDGSSLHGEGLHDKRTNPTGLFKLGDEVKRHQLKVAELESVVSTQHTEISKWKSRAIKLKAKGKTEMDKPSPPRTPTKLGHQMTSKNLNSPSKFQLTPRNLMDSPRKCMAIQGGSMLDSPKSRFFDAAGSSELLSSTCPKQFFDNSSLGTIPGAAAAGTSKEWWPDSPKHEDMCTSQ